MIHTHLIQMDQEDADEDGYEYEDGNHGPNFVMKMSDINKKSTNLNITVSRIPKFPHFPFGCGKIDGFVFIFNIQIGET